MNLRVFLYSIVLGTFGILSLCIAPLYAQITLSNSPEAPHAQNKEISEENNPFTRSPAAADSPSVQDSTQSLTGPVIPSFSPSVPFPSGISYQIFGNDAPTLKNFDCYTVLFGIPSYQNAQAQGACFDAQTACVRLGLIQQFLTKAKQKQLASKFPGSVLPEEDLEEILSSSLKDVRLRLTGCVVAIAASTITDSVIEQAGFPPPKDSGNSAANSQQPPALQ